MSHLHLPDGLTIKGFLADYWQQRALLMPAALDVSEPGISPEELAGLTLEDWVESRLIVEVDNNWHLSPGPLPESLYNELPDHGWTILVNDVDKHLPEMTRWLRVFDFLPQWRMDDLMISYATAGGSVGPHWDEYDVFLLQVQGHRQWSIAPGPYSDADLRDDCELKVLADFTPAESWRLGPGDMLYLPPGVGHWGVAEDDCLTYSIGFRAPSRLSLFEAAVDKAIDDIDPHRRYQDPGLTATTTPNRIDASALASLSNMIRAAWPQQLEEIVATQLTQPKSHWPQPTAPEPAFQADELNGNGILAPWPYSRWLLWEHEGTMHLSVNGRHYPCPATAVPLFEALARGDAIALDEEPDQATLQSLTGLINDGLILLEDE